MQDTALLTPSIERIITKDWASAFADLEIYKPRRLLRRVGPLLIGICLERDSSGAIYKPIFHVHFLGAEFSTVSLTLNSQMRSQVTGGPDFIQVRFHEQKYREAAERMASQSLLPLAGEVWLDDVERAYRAYIDSDRARGMRVALYRDLVLLRSWARQVKTGETILAECLHLSDEEGFRFYGGRSEFAATCRRAIDNPGLIHETVSSEARKLNVDAIRATPLLVST